MTPSGKLMSMPISPLIPMLYYRGDLYKEAGLKAPELSQHSRQRPQVPLPAPYLRHRAAGCAWSHTVVVMGLLALSVRSRRRDLQGPGAGDYSVILNDRQRKGGARLLYPAGPRGRHPKTAALDQAEVIQNMVTGKAAHT